MARKTVMVGRWKALADKLGGVGKLAAALDRNRSTVERWAEGSVEPGREVQVRVGELAAEHGLAGPPFGAAAAKAAAK